MDHCTIINKTSYYHKFFLASPYPDLQLCLSYGVKNQSETCTDNEKKYSKDAYVILRGYKTLILPLFLKYCNVLV